MKPYYDDGSCVIYHGDCEVVLHDLGPVDLVVTSPPYNLGVSSGSFGHYDWTAAMKLRGGGGKWHGCELADGYDGHDDAMDPVEYEAWQRHCLTLMWNTLGPAGAIFYNHKPRVQGETLWMPTRLIPSHMPVRQIITWARAGGMNYAPTHYVPTYEWVIVIAPPSFRLKSKGASGVGDLWRIPQESNSLHPAPFPLALPARIIETTGPNVVLDPFLGSGTTLVAAKAAGVRGIGIEKSERYCEIAAKRLAQEVLAFG